MISFLTLSLLTLARAVSQVTAQISGFPPDGFPPNSSFPGPGQSQYSWDELMAFATVQPDTSGMLPAKTEACTEKLQRRAWQVLTDAEKTEYLNAEFCLMSSPTKTNIGGRTRYDDLVKAHQLQAFLVHSSASFLPYHRLQMHAHERVLREECGYTGAQPYWDEELDAGSFTTASIFDPVVGFGGDGTGADGCIETGPFANYSLITGPGYENTEHCITRIFSDRISNGSATANVEACLALGDYSTAWPCMEENPHNGGHGGVGGEMSNAISSPGDPLFYLHHSFLDRIWWRWQERDLPARLTDIAGYTSEVEPPTGWVNGTLDDVLNMYGVIPNATVRDVMDIGGDLLCFEYV